MSNIENEKKESVYYVAFIDILYAVVLNRALLEISDILDLPNQFYQNIISFPFLLFVISIGVVLRDWISYHRDISVRRHSNPFRFFIDILILFFFFQMARSYKNASNFFLMTMFYFAAVFIWTISEYSEYKKETRYIKDMRRNLLWNFVYTALFFLTHIVILYTLLPLSPWVVALVSFLIYLVLTIIRGISQRQSLQN